MYVSLSSAEPPVGERLGPIEPVLRAAGSAPTAGEAPSDHATAVLDLLSGVLTGLVGLAFLLYVSAGLVGILAAALLRTGRRPPRPGPDAAA